MKCIKCGNENKENAVFCRNCGTKLELSKEIQFNSYDNKVEKVIVPEEYQDVLFKRLEEFRVMQEEYKNVYKWAEKHAQDAMSKAEEKILEEKLKNQHLLKEIAEKNHKIEEQQFIISGLRNEIDSLKEKMKIMQEKHINTVVEIPKEIKLVEKCPTCGAICDSDTMFCGNCGTKIIR